MSDDPVGHESAVASACFAYLCLINIRILFQYSIREVHQIPEICSAVIIPDIRKGIASAVRSLDICKEDNKPSGYPQLHFVEECLSVCTSRTAVNIKNCRILLLRAEVLGQQYPSEQIISLGIPATAVYNFGASTLRSVGDSKTPLVILSLSGITNVLLNLFFVIVCGV